MGVIDDITADINDDINDDIYDGITIDINGEVDDEEYTFNEGKYHFDNEYFWGSIVESDLEYALEQDVTKAEFILDHSYVSEDDKKELEKMYDEYIIENNKIQIK